MARSYFPGAASIKVKVVAARDDGRIVGVARYAVVRDAVPFGDRLQISLIVSS